MELQYFGGDEFANQQYKADGEDESVNRVLGIVRQTRRVPAIEDFEQGDDRPYQHHHRSKLE